MLQHPWPQRLRVLLLACLMVALPLYGSSAATLKLLGPVHRHAGAVAHDPAPPHAHAHAHPHHHTGWQQHHHHPHEPGLVTAGAGSHAADTAADEAAAGSAMLPLAPAYGLRLPATAARRRPWPRPRRAAWKNRPARRLERPPQAC
ncbi:hypothetical protein MW290_10225 [Aquincola tertiaricarbonis]|uniref:Uncharacterized protein n=1 Tax=Aquincola tertiaricarbonis TaxID=391953 RepID=A0ABY4S3C2_AQUTE|nr:hypothetical protein [Aquincola tertiaricarbonis]URI06296.1 hypothetical protein MW290_10225 [Aquincola tertiaricarbonis]